MNTLTVSKVSFHGIVNRGALDLVTERLDSFSYEFSFRKSYLLACDVGEGGWALSRIIGGLLEPNDGVIKRNDVLYPAHQRRKDVWCVRHSEIKRFGLFRNRSLKSQIQHGLRTVSDQYLKSEAEIINRFYLTPERYNRLLRQFSSEGWSASCAIGIANGKKIFCFPHLRQGFIEEYYSLWLKEMIDLLRDSGALVLIPATLTPRADKLCDEVVLLNKGLS
jgi:ABC-type Na+ transport system ATPase subunit NatA